MKDFARGPDRRYAMFRPSRAVAVLLALASAACFSFTRESTRSSPSATTSSLLGGLWQSSQFLGGGSPAESCTNFRWQVTEFSGTTGSGTFSATCLGGLLSISGSARGTITGTSVNWTATATATAPGIAACPISLQGTAELSNGEIRIPYSGTTCLGPVSGIEVLRR